MISSDAPILLTEPPLGRRDYYREFIEGSRWLRKEHAAARLAWFEGLTLVNKEMLLFEFEMLIKGLICFGNPVNHPGPPVRGDPAVARQFKSELIIVREIVKRIIEVGRRLTVQKGKSIVFQRYVQSIIGQDEARFKMVKKSLDQDVPDQSMALIISAFGSLQGIIEGLIRTPHVSYRLFSNVIDLAQREIHRSTFFNPLAALEFRVEFDKIQSEKVLQLLSGIESEPARRVLALAFLSQFRLIKYIQSIKRSVGRQVPPPVFFSWLAVLRSDLRALIIFLKREAARWLANGFGTLYEQCRPTVIKSSFSGLEQEFKELRSLKDLLASLGDQLRLEQVKVYEQQLPAVAAVDNWMEFRDRVVASTLSLYANLQHSVVLLAKELDGDLRGSAMFIDYVSARERSSRLRRDIWMFQKILRAFIEKTKGSVHTTDKWSEMSTFRFVREFVGYFRSMGYHLLRYADYEEFDKFMMLVDRLREGDVLDVQQMYHVVHACEGFMAFLDKTLEAVGQREELAEVPFDAKDAARTLKLFLKRY